MHCHKLAPPLLIVFMALVSWSTVTDSALAVEGLVLAVPQADLCEISIGSDDGIKKGHKLEVYRITDNGAKYVGRIIVMKTAYDRAACKIDPKFKKLPMQRGDRVTSKIR